MDRNTSQSAAASAAAIIGPAGIGFAEPDDVRPQQAAAGGAPRESVARFLGAIRDRLLDGAAVAQDVAVVFEHAAAPGALVQAVDVLGDERQAGHARARVRPARGGQGSARPCEPAHAGIRTSPRRTCGSRSNASGVARSSGLNFAHSPVSASRNVGIAALGGDPRAREHADVPRRLRAPRRPVDQCIQRSGGFVFRCPLSADH